MNEQTSTPENDAPDRILRLATADPLDAYEEGVQVGWALALAWAGVADSRVIPPGATS